MLGGFKFKTFSQALLELPASFGRAYVFWLVGFSFRVLQALSFGDGWLKDGYRRCSTFLRMPML